LLRIFEILQINFLLNNNNLKVDGGIGGFLTPADDIE